MVLLATTAGWAGYTGIKAVFTQPACAPGRGQAYCIAHAGGQPKFIAGTAAPYSFSIIDAAGKTVTDFKPVHEKLLHLIVVRTDLLEFQHIHPTLDEKTGIFSLADFTLPTDGTYRIFADFMEAGKEQVTIYETITAGDPSAHAPTETIAAKTESSAGDYLVRLKPEGDLKSNAMTTLVFTITKNGLPVTDLEPYLGAYAHAVIIRNGTLEYIHTHPQTDKHAHATNPFAQTAQTHGPSEAQTGTVSLMTTFPFGGDYKLFFQIQHAGVVRTFDFTLPVLQGAAGDHGEEMH